MKSLSAKLEQLHGLLGTGDLSPREQSFIESCWSRSDGARKTSALSPAQVEWLDDLYNKHFA